MLIEDRPPPSDVSAAAAAAFRDAVEHLCRADWSEAQALFRSVVDEDAGCAEAWEGLAEASWWILDEPVIFDARERAHRLYRDSDDRLSAARMAAWLAMDHVELRGENAIANGWLRVAYRLTERRHGTVEYGLVNLLHARICLIAGDDVAGAQRLASRAALLGRRRGTPGLEVLAIAIEGAAWLAGADVTPAVRCLDEAGARVVAGDVKNLTLEALVLCELMGACERMKDYHRAQQWCARVQQVSEERSFPTLLALCRPHYAGVLMSQGLWEDAEEQLQAARRELTELVPPFVEEATVRLARLRLRQGRFDDAAELLDRIEHPAGHLAMAELCAEKGELETAVELVERYLRRLSPAEQTERANALELLVRCLSGIGRLGDASSIMDQLRGIAGAVATVPLRASTAFAEGLLAAGAGDLQRAQRCLEDAVDLYSQSGAAFEGARAGIVLARVLAMRYRTGAACREAAAARDTLQRLGAVADAVRADELLARIESEGEGGNNRPPGDLTARELEILSLLAAGRSNSEIATDLVISVRTVERHISNIYQKLGLQGRAARTQAAARAHRFALNVR